MKRYASFFKIRFIQGLQYRTAAYAGILTQFMWGAMEVLLFSVFHCFELEALPVGFSQLASYYWLQQAFLILFMTWLVGEEIFQAISSDTMAYELYHPMDIYSMWFAESLANRASKTVLRCMPIPLAALLLPKPYRLALPPNARTAVLFLLSMALGFLVIVAFSMPIYITTFFALSPLGIRVISPSLIEFVSGGITPLPFLPGRIRGTMKLLPFTSMQNAPYRIYSASTAGAAAVGILPLQLFWVIALTVLSYYPVSLALRRIVIQGGWLCYAYVAAVSPYS